MMLLTRRHLVGLLLLGAILFLAGVATGLGIVYGLGIHNCLDGGGNWDAKLDTCVLHDR